MVPIIFTLFTNEHKYRRKWTILTWVTTKFDQHKKTASAIKLMIVIIGISFYIIALLYIFITIFYVDIPDGHPHGSNRNIELCSNTSDCKFLPDVYRLNNTYENAHGSSNIVIVRVRSTWLSSSQIRARSKKRPILNKIKFPIFLLNTMQSWFCGKPCCTAFYNHMTKLNITIRLLGDYTNYWNIVTLSFLIFCNDTANMAIFGHAVTIRQISSQ